jgi:hypothetical protein
MEVSSKTMKAAAQKTIKYSIKFLKILLATYITYMACQLLANAFIFKNPETKDPLSAFNMILICVILFSWALETFKSVKQKHEKILQ